MKIVHVCNYTAPARDAQGSQRILESLARAQVKNGDEVFLCINKDSKTTIAPVVDNPYDADIVHYHGGFPEDYNHKRMASWLTTNHGGGNDNPSKYHEKNKKHIVCVSNFVKEKIKGYAYVLNGVPPEDYIFKEKKEDYFLWLSGTDWGEQKGLFSTILLAKKLKFKLKIAGTGKNTSIIKEVERMCDDRIEFLGAVNGEEKAELLASAKATFMIGKILDACPTVTIESMLSGTPVIARNIAAHPEMIGEFGFLCKNDKEIIKSILNVEKISPIQCREYALRKFSHTKCATEYRKIYEKIIKDGDLG